MTGISYDDEFATLLSVLYPPHEMFDLFPFVSQNSYCNLGTKNAIRHKQCNLHISVGTVNDWEFFTCTMTLC